MYIRTRIIYYIILQYVVMSGDMFIMHVIDLERVSVFHRYF